MELNPERLQKKKLHLLRSLAEPCLAHNVHRTGLLEDPSRLFKHHIPSPVEEFAVDHLVSQYKYLLPLSLSSVKFVFGTAALLPV